MYMQVTRNSGHEEFTELLRSQLRVGSPALHMSVQGLAFDLCSTTHTHTYTRACTHMKRQNSLPKHFLRNFLRNFIKPITN